MSAGKAAGVARCTGMLPGVLVSWLVQREVVLGKAGGGGGGTGVEASKIGMDMIKWILVLSDCSALAKVVAGHGGTSLPGLIVWLEGEAWRRTETG